MAPLANNATCGPAGRPEPAEPPLPSARPVLASAAAIAGSWIAAGSVGLVGHALARAFLLAVIAVIVVAAWSGRGGRRSILFLLAGAAVAVAMTVSTLPVVQILALVVVLAAAASVLEGAARRAVLLAATAVAVFALYRLAVTSIPFVWLAADAAGGVVGRAAGELAGRPLWVGATFAGLDFLVLMAALWVAWLVAVAPPRWPRALAGATAIVAAHGLYLTALAFAPDMPAALGVHAPADEGAARAAAEAAWTWAAALRSLVPWNLPVAAAAMHLVIVAAMLWPPAEAYAAGQVEESPGRQTRRANSRDAWRRAALAIAAALLAAAVPLAATLSCGRADLAGKKIVIYEKGFLNWLKPEHGDYGRLAIGMYGLMPAYMESLGARPLVSPDLSEADLRDADVLVLLYPNELWAAGQLERMWGFVRRGGSLLVCGEHTVSEGEKGGSRFNEVLAPTAMQVRFDSAMFEVGGWLNSYEALAHPTSAGIADDRNTFGVVIGASVEARWPARPLLVGRWGFCDPGDPKSARAMMGNGRYDSGERLGDIVLAAEQPFGAGKVIAFGDPSGLTNGITVGAHPYTSRLYAYLAGGAQSPQEPWRGVLAILMAATLVTVLAYRPDSVRLALAAGALAAALAIATAASSQVARVLPDGRRRDPNNLAYMDTAHLSVSSEESWRPDGTMGLAMMFMRCGYLTLNLPEMTPERLERAAIVASVAPSRAFTAAERRALRDFVEGGGTFILTVGYDSAGPSRDLLADFGLHVGRRPGLHAPGRDPEPLGHFKSPYVKVNDYVAHVRFHAAWPVYADDPNDANARVVAYGLDEAPVILLRRIGKGKVLLVGDTGFAENKNLEHEGGEPFEGMRENADFWRWMIDVLADRRPWLPQPPPPPAAGSEVRP